MTSIEALVKPGTIDTLVEMVAGLQQHNKSNDARNQLLYQENYQLRKGIEEVLGLPEDETSILVRRQLQQILNDAKKARSAW